MFIANEELISTCDTGPMLHVMEREDFTDGDWRGLQRALKRDPLKHTMYDVEGWLTSGAMTMWRYQNGKQEFGMLLQIASDPTQKHLVIAYIWGSKLKENAFGIFEMLKRVAKDNGCRYITATFNSMQLFKRVPVAKFAYVYGYYEV